MKNKPLLGLWLYAFHEAKGSLVLFLLFAIALGGVIHFFDHQLLVNSFPMTAIGYAPFIIIMKTGDKANWDRFKISMPLKRRDVIFASYFNIFFASLMGLPIVAVVWAIGVVDVNILLVGFSYGVVFVVSALAYVLSFTKLSKTGDTGLLLICMLVGTGLVAGMSVAGSTLGLLDGVVALSIISITFAIFVISMLITAKLYKKIDF